MKNKNIKFMQSLASKGSLSLLLVLTLCLLGNVAEAQAAQCNDNIDNDGDQRIDLNDRGCRDGSDNNETAQVNGAFTNWIPANNITVGSAPNLSFGFGPNDDTAEIARIKFRVNAVGRPWSEYEALEQDFAAPYEYSAASLNRVTAGNNKIIYAQIYGKRGNNPHNLYLISSSYYITRFLPSSTIQTYQCNDGLDNDLDTATDYPADPGCISPQDALEATQVSGNFTNLNPTYRIGVDGDLNLSIQGDTHLVRRVMFKTWSASLGAEGVFIDDSAPYVYPRNSLNLVTPGAKYVQAYVLGETNNVTAIITTVSQQAEFLAGSIINQAPTVNAGLDQTLTLPNTAALSGTATDDGLPNPPAVLTKTWTKVSGPGTVTFGNANTLNTTASFSLAGTYVLRLTASDSVLSTFDDVTITVNPAPPVNTAPTVNAGANQTITLPEVATLDATASDDGLPNPPGTLTGTWTKVSGPGTVTFGNLNAVDTTASFSIAGSYTLRLTVNDSALSASDDIDITVNPVPPVNQAPVLNPIGNKSVNENNLLSFVISGTDPDNDPLTYTASNLPSGANFNALTRTFTWTPSLTQSGNYNMTFRVTDGTLDDSEQIMVTVANVNQAPVLNAIGNRTVNENQLLSFVISGSDPDNDPLTYTASNLPSGATFDALTRTFTWTPSLTQSGNYPMTFRVSDGTLEDSELITVSVGNVNQAPVLNSIGNRTVNENQLLSFVISGSDPDNDPLTYTASNLPSGATFDALTRTFTWTPSLTQSGNYPMTFRVSDGTLEDSELITVSVGNVNQAPVLNSIGNRTVNENQLLSFVISGSDPDNDPLTYTASNLPSGAIFNAQNRTFTWTPSLTQSGNYPMTFRVSDGTLEDSELITVSVGNVNQAPVLNSIGNRTVNENQLLSFVISGTDPDNDPLTYTASNLPSGANFNPQTRTFTWTPSLTQSGNYNMTFRVSDGTLEDSELITVSVGNVNQAPVLNAIGNRTVNENALLSFVISGSDPDNDPLTYTASNLPSGASFNAQNRTFTWTPSLTQSGNYPMTFRVSDGTLDDSEQITITVGNVNQAPVLNSIGNRTVNENQLLSFVISGSDPDNDPLTYSAETLPQGASFNAQNRTFTWTPSLTQSGNYPMTFRVSDGTLDDIEQITITVANVIVNTAPVVSAGANQTITLPSTANLIGTATDDGLPNPPGTMTRAWTKVSGPGTVTFGSANTLSTTASFSLAGTYVLRLTASDSLLSTSDDVTITVNPAPPVNQAPVVNAGSNQTITLPSNANLDATVTDDGLPIPPTMAYAWTKVSGPGTVTFGNANAVDTTATFSAAGSYVLRLTANDSLLSTSDDVTVTVNSAPPVNQAPSVNAGINQTITLPSNVNLDGTVTDDGLPNPPAAVTTNWSKFSGTGAVIFGNASAVDTTATFLAAGTYVLRLTANDGSALSSFDDVTIIVNPTMGQQQNGPITITHDFTLQATFQQMIESRLNRNVAWSNAGITPTVNLNMLQYFFDPTMFLNMDTVSSGQTPNTPDITGHGFDATIVGAVHNSTGGKFGGAFTFNGLNNLLEIQSGPLVDNVGISATGFSLGLWVKPTTLQGSQKLAEQAWGNADLLISGGQLQCSVRYSTSVPPTVVSTPASVLTINEWSHVLCSLDRGNMSTPADDFLRLYVNGIQQATAVPQTAGLFSTYVNTPFGIGHRPAGAQSGQQIGFSGQIDDVAVWRRPLSNAEALHLGTATVPFVLPPTSGFTSERVASGYFSDLSYTLMASNPAGVKVDISTNGGADWCTLLPGQSLLALNNPNCDLNMPAFLYRLLFIQPTTLQNITFTLNPNVPPVSLSSGPMGMNLGGVYYWSSDVPFVDLMTKASPWTPNNNGTTPVTYDTNGYPTGLLAGQSVYSILAISNYPGSYPGGAYTLKFEGQGSVQVSYTGGTPTFNTAGTHTVNIPAISAPGNIESIILRITGSNPANPVRNIHLWLPGFNDTTTQTFHPDWLRMLQGIKTIRFMNWDRTNGSPLTTWSQRTTPQHFTQARDQGVSLENEILLANTLQANPWFCIPLRADDTYVANMADLIRNTLHFTDPNRKFYVELSNEIWNFGFLEAHQASTLGLAANLSQNYNEARIRYTAYRSFQIFMIIRNRLGPYANRLVPIIAGQAGWVGLNRSIMDAALLYNPGISYAFAIAPYLGDQIANFIAGANADLTTDVEMVIDRLEDTLEEGAQSNMAANFALLNQYPDISEMVAYEGSFHNIGTFNYQNDYTVASLMSASNRHPRIQRLIERYLSKWFELGGGVFSYFTFITGDSKYGIWGAAEGPFEGRSAAPKLAAVQNIIGLNELQNGAIAICGNGILQSGEECDGSQFRTYNGTAQCSAHDWKLYGNGTLSCNSQCAIETTNCTARPPALVDISFDTNHWQRAILNGVYAPLLPGNTTKLLAKVIGGNGELVTLQVWERDSGVNNDDLITTVTTTCDHHVCVVGDVPLSCPGDPDQGGNAVDNDCEFYVKGWANNNATITTQSPVYNDFIQRGP